MKYEQIIEALQCMWTIVRDDEMVVMGSQSMHAQHPDMADDILFSREVDIVLKKNARLANWIDDVVGEDSLFAQEHGFFIDHLQLKHGLPVLAIGWDERTLSVPVRVFSGTKIKELNVQFLSLPDLIISKLHAWREKDQIFMSKLYESGLLEERSVESLIPLVDGEFREKVQTNFKRFLQSVTELKSTSDLSL